MIKSLIFKKKFIQKLKNIFNKFTTINFFIISFFIFKKKNIDYVNNISFIVSQSTFVFNNDVIQIKKIIKNVIYILMKMIITIALIKQAKINLYNQ